MNLKYMLSFDGISKWYIIKRIDGEEGKRFSERISVHTNFKDMLNDFEL